MVNEKVELRRSIGLVLLTLYGLGNILGAGIYVLVGKVAGEAGYAAPVSFFIASIAAGFSAFTYAELSARYPVSAGEAVYLYKGFKLNVLSGLVGLMLALAGVASAAALAHGFAGYFQEIAHVSENLLVGGLILTLGVIASWGIGESVKIASLLTIIELLGLVIIATVGLDTLIGDSVIPASPLGSSRESSEFAIDGIFVGAFLAFYAFIGFEDMINIAEEVENPQRNLPLATILSLIAATALYALISYVSVNVVDPQRLSESNAPLALVYAESTGKDALLITIISLFAVVNGALIQIIMGSRILYGMANNGWMPQFLTSINARTQTPLVSTVIITLALLIFALAFPFVTLVEMTSYLILSVFTLVNWALIRIKKVDPNPEGVKTFPVIIPILGMTVSLLFIVLQVGQTILS
ncbi:MAG: amino acid permease [Gammaproteobacteria bacterium]|nr:amino acid permease [Gammaproteobacteria bacterium]